MNRKVIQDTAHGHWECRSKISISYNYVSIVIKIMNTPCTRRWRSGGRPALPWRWTLTRAGKCRRPWLSPRACLSPCTARGRQPNVMGEWKDTKCESQLFMEQEEQQSEVRYKALNYVGAKNLNHAYRTNRRRTILARTCTPSHRYGTTDARLHVHASSWYVQPIRSRNCMSCLVNTKRHTLKCLVYSYMFSTRIMIKG